LPVLVAGRAGDTYLVLGATGTVGRRVAAQLRAAGHAVRPASRHGETQFDWQDERTWAPTVEGATHVVLMAPDGQPVEPAFVELAVDRGVGRIVLLSSRAIDVMGDERLLAAERTVQAAGAEWTVVRADWFDQNFDENFLRDAVLAGDVRVPVGDVRQCFVHADDIAAVAVAALTQAGHEGRTYEVTGPEALSFAEAVAMVSERAGRPVSFDGSADAYAELMAGFGLPAEEVEQELRAFAALREAGDSVPTDVVQAVTGRAPKDFATYVEEVLAQGGWCGGARTT
jgi:uncharacterized protein YbjT (DUF2867 family)